MAQSVEVIALDVGGSSIKSGIVYSDSASVHNFTLTRIDSNVSAELILNTLLSVIHLHLSHLKYDDLLHIGLGFPGPFDYEKGISYLKDLTKYESIYNLNIREWLLQNLPPKTEILFLNDAEAAIIGEGVYGIGCGYSRIIGLTLGTGCGSAFLVKGKAQKEGKGVPANGWLYPVVYKDQQADDIFSTRGLLNQFTKASINIDSIESAIIDADNNVTIQSVFHEFGDNLGRFLQQFLHEFQADAVILQGGISEAHQYFIADTAHHLSVPILIGTLKQEAALLGIAKLFH